MFGVLVLGLMVVPWIDGCAMDWMSFLGLDRWLRGLGGMGWWG